MTFMSLLADERRKTMVERRRPQPIKARVTRQRLIRSLMATHHPTQTLGASGGDIDR